MVHIHTTQNSQNQPKHLPKLGWFIYLLATAAMLGGFLYGYNSGIVSPALIYLPNDSDMKPMSYTWIELVVAITPGMAGVGALPAGMFSDKFGRKKVIISSSIIYGVGALLCAIAFNKWILLIGRIFIGLGLGLSSMIVPVYVSEASPVHIRAGVIVPSSRNDSLNSHTKHYDTCMKFSNCDNCVTSEHCGFCTTKSSKSGYCLPVDKDNPDKYSSAGYCKDKDDLKKHNITQKYQWSNDYCHTDYTVWILIFVFIYLAFFGAEFYPLWASGTCVSITTFVHWFFNLIITLTFLSLNEAITKYGNHF
uniref:Major facilitator superfamily (MFS) profile domain-containing protein n=1 Tax=Acrobeloides nanus TaxID=290746 RepID=A0A914D772_9BILA